MWLRLFPWMYPIALAASFADDLIAVLWLWNIRRCSWMQHCLGLASAVRFAGTVIASARPGSNLWIYQWTNPLSAGFLFVALAGWTPRSSRAAVLSVGAGGILGYYILESLLPGTGLFKDANEVLLSASALICAIIALGSTSMRQRSLWGPGIWAAIGTFWYWGANGVAYAFANPVYETGLDALRLLFNVRNVFVICGIACWLAAMPGPWLRRAAMRESVA